MAAVMITERAVSATVLLLLTAMAVVVIIVVVLAAFVLSKLLVGTLNDFVELAAVEPDTAALGAVINFPQKKPIRYYRTGCVVWRW